MYIHIYIYRERDTHTHTHTHTHKGERGHRDGQQVHQVRQEACADQGVRVLLRAGHAHG